MADLMTRDGYAQALIAEFVSAVEAVLGGVSATPAAGAASGNGWIVAATATGDLRGSITAWMDRAGAEAIAQRVLGMDDTPDGETVSDMLREMWSQAAGALAMKDPFTGISLSIATVTMAAAPDGVTIALDASGALAHVAVGGDAAAPQMPAKTAEAPARVPELVGADTLEAVLDMQLPLVVRFARTVMPLKTLASLGPGSIVDMERSPDEPVQMLVGDRMIARGEVVVVGGHYGVRVTDLVSAAERARALEV